MAGGMMTKSKLVIVVLFALLVAFLVSCGGKKEEPVTDGKQPKGVMAKEKYVIAMKELQTLGMAVESYVTDNDQSPEAGTIKELQAKISPFHIRVMPLNDPWGNPYLYKKTGPDGYAVACSGYDGSFEGFHQEGSYSADQLTGQDIIYDDGGFSLSPQMTDPIKD